MITGGGAWKVLLPNKGKRSGTLFWRVEQGCVIVNACPFCLVCLLIFTLIIYFLPPLCFGNVLFFLGFFVFNLCEVLVYRPDVLTS